MGKLFRRLPAIFRHGYALFFIIIGWLIFRASGLEQIGTFLIALFGGSSASLYGDVAQYLILQFRWEWFFAIVAATPIKEVLQHTLEAHSNFFTRFLLAWTPPILALTLGVLALIQLTSFGFNPFIYFQF